MPPPSAFRVVVVAAATGNPSAPPPSSASACLFAAALSLKAGDSHRVLRKAENQFELSVSRAASRVAEVGEQKAARASGERNVSTESAEPELQSAAGGARRTPSPRAARTREPEPPSPRFPASVLIAVVQARTHSSLAQTLHKGGELIKIKKKKKICLTGLGQLIRREVKEWRT